MLRSQKLMSVVLYHTDCCEGTGSCLGFVSSTRDGTVLGSEVDSLRFTL